MSGSPVVQRQPHCSVTRECESVFTGECQGPTPSQRRGGESGAATEDGAEQSARGQNCGERAEDARKTSCVKNAAVARTLRKVLCKESSIILWSGPSSQSVLLFFSTPGKKPPLTFRLDSRGICFLQYDVSRHPWPQLSRMPVSREKGISAVPCRALGHSLLGAFILMPHTKLMPNTAM